MFSGDIDQDCWLLFNFLEPLNYYTGSERKRNQFKGAICKKNGGSVLYGYTWKGFLKYNEDGTKLLRKKSKYKGLFETKIKELYPELEDIFKEFGQIHFPNFPWVNVQINKDYITPPHYDSSNVGESVIVALGDYTEGELCVDRKSYIEEINIRHKPYQFNGSIYKHWVKPHKSGCRISVVFFNSKCLKDKIKI